jgi:hypothetical protein
MAMKVKFMKFPLEAVLGKLEQRNYYCRHAAKSESAWSFIADFKYRGFAHRFHAFNFKLGNCLAVKRLVI